MEISADETQVELNRSNGPFVDAEEPTLAAPAEEEPVITLVETAEEAASEISPEAAVDRGAELVEDTLVPRVVAPRPVTEEAVLKDPALYFNQELSWLDFNWRVLYLAMDERTPLLERVRFAAITASNLDEFIQKRVGGLKRQQAARVRKLSPDGRTPSEQLALIGEAAKTMHQTMTEVWERELKPALRQDAGIFIHKYDDLNPDDQTILHQYFQREIYPILTPLTVDPGHPFPFISNLSLSLAIILQHNQRESLHFARLKVPTNLGRWLPLHEMIGRWDVEDQHHFLPLEQLIANHVEELFQGMEVVNVHPFRIIRNADISRDEEEAEDLLSMISDELRERRFAPVVRLELASQMPEYDRNLLIRELGLSSDDVYEVDGMLDLTACNRIADIILRQHKYHVWEPVVPSRLFYEGETKDTQNIFAIIRQGDLLVHHPYDSFAASTQRLIEEAAADKQAQAAVDEMMRTISRRTRKGPPQL